MRESFTYGSVRGAGSNPSPYRDRRAAIALGTGRLAPCRFCAEQARYTAGRWLWSAPTCRSFGFPWGSEVLERQAERDGLRRAAIVVGTGRLGKRMDKPVWNRE
jgi:hypothetical protein